MSVGLLLLKSLVRERDSSNLYKIKESVLQDEEIQAFRFIQNHHRRHGRLPTERTLERNGVFLSDEDVEESFSYYHDRCVERATIAVLQSHTDQYMNSLRERNIDQALRILKTMNDSVSRLRITDSLSDQSVSSRRIQEKYQEAQRMEGLSGITFGWPTLDRVTDGAQPCDLICLVGRPSMGKSMYLLYWAYSAWKSNKRILFVSMEMGETPISRRLIGIETGINPNHIKRGTVPFFSLDAMNEVIENYESRPPFYILSGNLRKSVDDIYAVVLEYEPDIVYVDASYLLVPSQVRYKSTGKRDMLSDVAEGLKGIALQSRIPVVITVQFNREVDKKMEKKRNGNQPVLGLSYIYDSDVYGQLASVVVGMCPSKPPYEKERRQIEVMKNREDETAVLECYFGMRPMNLSEVPESESSLFSSVDGSTRVDEAMAQAME